MTDNSTRKFLKILFGLAIGGMVLVFCIGMSSSTIVRAQDAWTETPTKFFYRNPYRHSTTFLAGNTDRYPGSITKHLFQPDITPTPYQPTIP